MIDTIIEFLKEHTLNVVLILAFAAIAHTFGMLVLRKLIRRGIRPDNFKTKKELKQREDTLVSTTNAAVRSFIFIFTVLLLLAEFGVDIGPLIAGAGIAGIAIGFGAQSMVRDFLTGFFILVENHYRVGDVVELNQKISGVVEHITLRETVLRDLDGMVHHISNGEITIATNMTMEFSGINLDIGVSYNTDIEKAEKIINKIGEEIKVDEKWAEDIYETPQFLRVDDFADSAIIIKITGKTAPMRQWAVTGELRKRLKIAFDKNGIEIPFPQRVIHNQPSKK